MIRDEGLRGCFTATARRFSRCAVHDGRVGVVRSAQGFCQGRLRRRTTSSSGDELLAAIDGAVVGFATNPLDVVKTRIMTGGGGGPWRSSGVRSPRRAGGACSTAPARASSGWRPSRSSTSACTVEARAVRQSARWSPIHLETARRWGAGVMCARGVHPADRQQAFFGTPSAASSP